MPSLDHLRWTSSEIAEWILCLNPSGFAKYRDRLKASLSTSKRNMNGSAFMKKIQKAHHLKAFGITKRRHRELIFREMQKLTVRRSKYKIWYTENVVAWLNTLTIADVDAFADSFESDMKEDHNESRSCAEKERLSMLGEILQASQEQTTELKLLRKIEAPYAFFGAKKMM